MDFNWEWTPFALDTEVGAYGTSRIAKAHNALRKENAALKAKLKALHTTVDQQAKDDGLWFEAQTAPEAHLQQELRQLHAAVEG